MSVWPSSLVNTHADIDRSFWKWEIPLLQYVVDIFDIWLQFADNIDLHSEWMEAKRINKQKVVSLLKERTGYTVSPDAMFDIQVSGYFSVENWSASRCIEMIDLLHLGTSSMIWYG